MKKHTAIILVDDHVVVRNGLKELIELMGPYKVVAQYDNGRQLLDALPFKKTPDLLLLDLTMPVLNGEETVKRLKELEVKIPVLILTLNTDDEAIIRMFKLGVRGYLEKDCTAAGLRMAIQDILQYGYHHNDLLAKALAADDKPQPVNHRAEILKQITPRELEFLVLVCDDAEYTYDQMSAKMNVSVRTIDGYRESLFVKFGIRSKTGLVLFALKNDLCSE